MFAVVLRPEEPQPGGRLVAEYSLAPGYGVSLVEFSAGLPCGSHVFATASLEDGLHFVRRVLELSSSAQARSGS